MYFLLKKCHQGLVGKLWKYAKISSGVYPDDLKVAKVTAVYKSGDSCDVMNYRPISVLPVINKIFERLISRDYFEENVFPIFPTFSQFFPIFPKIIFGKIGKNWENVGKIGKK